MYWNTGIGVSYDISSAGNPNIAYTWTDPNDLATSNSTYTVNVGYNVPDNLVPCDGKGASSPAWQSDKFGGCYALSADFQHLGRSDVLAGFADPLNVAAGVTFQYNGGAANGGCPAGQFRNFKFVVMCAPNGVAWPAPTAPTPDSMGAFMDEIDTCTYVAWMRNTLGCPLECPRVNGNVCGTTGVCGYDDTIPSARCFCSFGYGGADCQTLTNPFPGGDVAGAVFGGIFTAMVFMVAFTWWSAKKGGKSGRTQYDGVDGFYSSGAL